MLNKLPYKILFNQLIGVSHSDAFIRPIDKWKAHQNQYLKTKDVIPHRAFSIFLFNSQNKLFFQRRSIHKKTFPLCWTNTCCSHPNIIQYQGQTQKRQQNIRSSLHRALYRQLKMDLTHQKFYLVDKILYKAFGQQGSQFGQHEVDYVFLCKIDKPNIFYQLIKEEVCQAEWVERNDFQKWIIKKQQQKCSFTPWFLKMHLNGLLGHWWENVVSGKLKDTGSEAQVKVKSL